MSFQVKYISELAYLRLSQGEEILFTESMDRIMHFVETITSLDLTVCNPAISSYEMPTSLRKDFAKEIENLDRLHQNTPCFQEGDIIVPQVIRKQ